MSCNVSTGIQAIIERKGLQKKFVAQEANLTKTQLSDMLHGRKRVLAEHLPALSRAMGVTIQDIYDAAGADRQSQ